MTQITVKVDDSQVKSILGNAVLAVEKLPDDVMFPILAEARDEVRTYPAERPGQRYIRTGNRYRATYLQKEGRAFRLYSNPRYGSGRSADPYVVGNALGQGQAWMHVGRWALLYEVMMRAKERIIQKAEEEFRRILSRGPGGL